jgi:hypothetical protein
MPLTIYDASNNVVWNSDAVPSGVFADIKSLAANAPGGTFNYPAFVGRSVVIIPLLAGSSAAAYGVTANTNPGYPQVIVSQAGYSRRFAVMVS